MRIDPAKDLKEYQKKNKKSPLWEFIDNVFNNSMMIVIIILFGWLIKDFILLWFSTIINTI